MNRFTHINILLGCLTVFFGAVGAVGCQSDSGETDDTDSEEDSGPAPVCPIPTELVTTEVIIPQDGAICISDRLNWDPNEQVSGCHLVLKYEYDQAEYQTAPLCPSGDGQEWIDDEGDLTVATHDDGSTHWIRSCFVQKRPSPILCADMAGNEAYDDYETSGFGWFYCENPGENNAIACSDGEDNDSDGDVDADDADCSGCVSGGECRNACPYQVSLSSDALAEAAASDSANIVCLTRVYFEDPNCM